MASPEYILSNGDFQIRHIPALIAMCALVGDYMWTCRFEFTYIWKRPINTYKVAFVVSRYVEIIGKIAHYSLIHLVLGRSRHGINPQLCAIWYTFLYTQCNALVMALDTILVLRAYALYQQKPIALLLAPPLVIPAILAFYDASYLLRHPERSFDNSCSAYFHGQTKNIGIAIGVSFIVAHGLLLLCVYMKRNIGHGRVPVVKLVVNEGVLTFIILFGIVTAALPMDVALDVLNPFIHFVFPSTLVSILTCRIIRSMHRLAIDTASNTQGCSLCDDDAFRLTTIISNDVGADMDNGAA